MLDLVKVRERHDHADIEDLADEIEELRAVVEMFMGGSRARKILEGMAPKSGRDAKLARLALDVWENKHPLTALQQEKNNV